MSFRIMAWTTAIAGLVLGVRFLALGAGVAREWGIEPGDGVLVFARRIGALYLGLAILFFLGRDAEPSALRSAVCLGVGAAIALLAALGAWDLAARRVKSTIIVPIVLELVLAAGFVSAWWSGRGG